MVSYELGAVMTIQENKWIDNDIFCDWLQHFKKNVPRGINKEKKHLLVLDGQKSHVNGGTLELYVQMGSIDVLTLLADTSHHMQPLDVSCSKPFKEYMQEEKVNCTLKNLGWGNGCMLKSSLTIMASKALGKALKSPTIIANFRATRICPLNREAMVKYYGPSVPHLEDLILDSNQLEGTNDAMVDEMLDDNQVLDKIHNKNIIQELLEDVDGLSRDEDMVSFFLLPTVNIYLISIGTISTFSETLCCT